MKRKILCVGEDNGMICKEVVEDSVRERERERERIPLITLCSFEGRAYGGPPDPASRWGGRQGQVCRGVWK